MKKSILMLALASVLLLSCKKEGEPEFERGDILINTLIEGRTGNQSNVTITMYSLNLSTPQFVLEEKSNNAGLLGLTYWIAEDYNIQGSWNDTLSDGTVNTYTADTVVKVIADTSQVLNLVLRQ